MRKSKFDMLYEKIMMNEADMRTPTPEEQTTAREAAGKNSNTIGASLEELSRAIGWNVKHIPKIEYLWKIIDIDSQKEWESFCNEFVEKKKELNIGMNPCTSVEEDVFLEINNLYEKSLHGVDAGYIGQIRMSGKSKFKVDIREEGKPRYEQVRLLLSTMLTLRDWYYFNGLFIVGTNFTKSNDSKFSKSSFTRKHSAWTPNSEFESKLVY